MISVQSLAVVIPVYNEEESLPALFAALNDLRRSLQGRQLRVLFVDDHSDDRSPALIRQASADNDWFAYVRLSQRSGSHIAVIAGFEQCDEDFAAFIAADLQDPPRLLLEMLHLCDRGYDVIWAVRDSDDAYNRFDAAASRLFYLLGQALVHARGLPQQATFALLSRRAYGRLVRECPGRPILHVNIAELGYPTSTVVFRKPARLAGRSKWTFFRKLAAFYDVVLLLMRVRGATRRPLYRIEEAAGLSTRVGRGAQ